MRFKLYEKCYGMDFDRKESSANPKKERLTNDVR